MTTREGPPISFVCRGGATETSGPHGWVDYENSSRYIAHRWGAVEIEESIEVCRRHADQLKAEGWMITPD